MSYVLISWAPEAPEARRAVDDLKTAFEAHGFTVAAKPAASASITDIAAADLVVYGVGATGSDYPAEYAGLVRVFSGANLAGRAAACFSTGEARASAGLRQHLRATGVSLFDEEPDPRGTGVREWADRVAAFLAGVRDGRR